MSLIAAFIAGATFGALVALFAIAAVGAVLKAEK